MRKLFGLAALIILVGPAGSMADITKTASQKIAVPIASAVQPVKNNTDQPETIPTISVEEFLQKMSGKYSGKGVAEIIGKKRDNILCKVENTYDIAQDGLLLSGNCASVKGKKAVTGKITYIDGKLSGALITGANVEITKSFGSIVKGVLVLTTYAMNNKTGNLTKVRQQISHTETGISTVFYRYNNKKREYLEVGSLDLKRLL